MKRIILTIALLLSITAFAQKAKKGDVPNSAYIVTNEQDAVATAALTGYLPKAGGTLNQNATLTFQDLYKTTAVGHDGVTMSDGPFGHAVTIEYPFDINGSFILATREWAAANYATPSAVSNQIAQSSSANFVVRMTATKTTAFTLAPTNATYVGDSSGSLLATNAVVAVLAGNIGDYVLAVGDTNNTFTTVQGTYVNADIYAYENETGDQQYKLEIYRRDLETDVMSEWGDGGPTFTITASMGKTSISIYVPSVSTNAFRVWTRLKRMGGNATSARKLYIGTGTGTPTFFSLTIPASVPIDVHNADPLAHPTITRSFLTWTAAGTNATYRMYWDATNGTFTVQEILP
jgi:hypothetical protein